MTSKKKSIISLILNVIIIISTVYAISLFFTTTPDQGNMQVSGMEFLRFFTNLSNIFVSIAALVMIVFNIRNLRTGSDFFPKWAMLLKFTATISVSVTFITVVVFLGPMFMAMGQSYWVIFAGNCFFLHFTTPVIAIISILFFEKCETFEKKYAFLGLLPTFLYSIVYVTMVVFVGKDNGGWPDFYGFTFGGKMYFVPISLTAMYALTILLSLTEWKIIQKINAKHQISKK